MDRQKRPSGRLAETEPSAKPGAATAVDGKRGDRPADHDARGGGRQGLSDRQSRRKAHVLTHHSASIVRSIADAVVIKDGEPFFLCPPDGQLPTSGQHGFGLYHHDTRFLRGYELTIAGATATSLAASAITGRRGILELTTPEIELGSGRTIGKERLAINWQRELDGDRPCLRDRISIHNYDSRGARLPLGFRFAGDFEDVFEVRGLLAERPGRLHEPAWEGDRLVLRYDGQDGVHRRLTVSFDRALEQRDGPSCGLSLDVDARASSSVEIELEIREDLEPGAEPIERRTRKGAQVRAQVDQPDSRTSERSSSGGDAWPMSVTSDSIALNAVLSRSLDDLLTLRGELDGQRYYAAGVPWFSTLFGRDSLISAYQTLAFDPQITEETLRLLARRQGTTDDPFRDEQPGRILHELRIGELARLHEIPQTPYYGSVDATPLFVVVLARYARWVGSLELFRELRPSIERALGWIDGEGDPTGSGYLTYASTVEDGLVNQGWKDSGDAIVMADGALAEPPIALAEVQGYVYAAKREIAELFERDGDADRADLLRRQAEDLRQRFERDFWSDRLGCYVLALAADGRRCEVATSNAGQVLWSQAASPEHARSVADRLLASDLFAGWGIRTLSASARAYNPIGYHLGTVWPHDNGLIAEGFRRFGLDEAAERVFTALVEASTDFPQQRLPECFAGYGREEFGTPVRYPIACHPQAWAAGAVPHLLTANLGLVPEAFEGRLRIIRPRLPTFLRHLDVRDLRVGGATVDLSFDLSGDVTRATVGSVHGELDVRVEGP